jgi:hypothetical protein
MLQTLAGMLTSTPVALNHTNWDLVSAKVYNQPMLIKNAVTLTVQVRVWLSTRSTSWWACAAKGSHGNLYRFAGARARYVYDNGLKGSAAPLVVPEWTDANDWAAACDPRVAPAIFVGERFGLAPEIFIAGDELSPAGFSNDEHRLKVRHYLAVWVNDFRPLFKCNVA